MFILPVDESSLGVHKIEFMIKTSPCFSNGSCVAQHANSSLYFSKIATRYNSWWLVVDSNLETSWAPIDELKNKIKVQKSKCLIVVESWKAWLWAKWNEEKAWRWSRHLLHCKIFDFEVSLKMRESREVGNVKITVLISKIEKIHKIAHIEFEIHTWMVLLVLMVAMAALTSLGTTSPRYSMQQAMYFPWRGSHLTIWLAGSKQALVISATESCSW